MFLAAPVALFVSFAVSSAVSVEERSETRVEIRGPVARVTVERVVSSRSLVIQSSKGYLMFDIALPPGARNLSVKATELSSGYGNAPRKTSPTDIVPSPAAAVDPSILAAISKVAFDSAATVRLAFEAQGSARFLSVTYSYSLSLSCRQGWWQMELPGAADLAPISGRLAIDLTIPGPLRFREVHMAGKSWRARGQHFRADADVSSQLEIPIAFQLGDVPQGASAGWSMLAEPENPTSQSVLGVCRAPALATASPPTVVIAVIDASRSVGVPGLSLQREFAKSFLSALPVSTRFNVISFASEPHLLFPFARLPTQEAFGLLDQHLIPERLANGTSLPLAMAAASKEVEQELRDDPLANPWVLLIADGSLPPTTTIAQAQMAATSRVLNLPLASVVLRAENDDQPPRAALRIFRNLSEFGGGAFRLVKPPAVSDQARSLVVELLAGGGWFDVRLQSQLIATDLGPGEGRVVPLLVGKQGALKRPSVGFRQRGRFGGVPVRRVRLPATWTTGSDVSLPLTATQTVLPSGRSVVVLPLLPPPAEATVGGELERSVLRNALSLSYLPRARACYLNRTATNARMRDLQGKVKLSLELERGEMLSATVLATTLDSPSIEKCLVDATFGLNIPRPLFRDAPAEAVLNLVFRPATSDSPDRGSADASLLDQELEVLLGPRRVVDTADDLGAIPGN